jgi:hypothetical protein
MPGRPAFLHRRRNVLRVQWIPPKRADHAGQILYVPLPVFAAVEAIQNRRFWKHFGNFLETLAVMAEKWKLSVNFLETYWKPR